MEKRERVTLPRLREMKRSGQKIVMVTVYDYSMASIVERAGIDMALVGDSLGMTLLGFSSTLPVTMEQMVTHTRAVTRACRTPFVLGDMPYMSYQALVSEAVHNAGRLMSEGGADGVKLEGGAAMAPAVAAIAAAGIPVMGHLGLTPQSMSMLGGFKAQGRQAEAAARIVRDAAALEEAGAFAILLECVPTKVAGLIARRATIPIISIGAGAQCDGQLLIFHDMFGLYPDFTPRFAKQYANAGCAIAEGLATYADEVRGGLFPGERHGFAISEEEFARLETLV